LSHLFKELVTNW